MGIHPGALTSHDRSRSFEQGCRRPSEDDASWNSKNDVGPRTLRADQCQLGPNSIGAFPEALQAKVAFFPVIDYYGIDPHAVVSDTHRQVLRITESNL